MRDGHRARRRACRCCRPTWWTGRPGPPPRCTGCRCSPRAPGCPRCPRWPARSPRGPPGCSSAAWSPTWAGGCSASTTRSAARTGDGRLLLVAPNVHAAQQALDVPAADFGLWVCLHEATHRLQFTAVPWLRSYFADEVGRFLSIAQVGAAGRTAAGGAGAAARRAAGDARPSGADSLAIVELLQGPEQRAVLDRLLALTTLLEGHADHVMDAVGPEVVPDVATIRARFTVRRRGGGLIDRILRALLGVEAKVRQYAVGLGVHLARGAGRRDGRVQPGVGAPGEPAHPRRAGRARARWIRRVLGRRTPHRRRATAGLRERPGPGGGRGPAGGAGRAGRAARRAAAPRRRWSPAPAGPTRSRWPRAPAPSSAGPVHAAVVDHGLQDGSAERAAATVELLAGLGWTPAVHPVEVDGPGGLEAAARRARYAALRAARPHPDSPVLLGHTLDDQAETVLLGLGRGSGPRSLAGMRHLEPAVAAPAARGAPRRHPGRLRRRAGCRSGTTRTTPTPGSPGSRLRHEVLPLLEEVLGRRGRGGAGPHRRPAARGRRRAGRAGRRPCWPTARDGRRVAGAAAGRRPPRGAPARAARLAARRGVTALTDAHLRAADVLAAPGPDRAGVALPGGLELVRAHGRLTLRPARWSTAVAPSPRGRPPCTTVTSRRRWSPSGRSATRPPSWPPRSAATTPSSAAPARTCCSSACSRAR